MTEEKKQLIIFDGNALIHRAFHALPPLTTKKGELVNAVYGFLLVFLRTLREFRPEFIAVAFDFPGPTFRHRKYKLYKANREKAPDELYQQIPKTKEILENLGVQVFEKEGYEADDIIGTIAKNVSQDKALSDIEIIIVSGDLDTLQLVDEKTKVYALRKGVKDIVLYGEKNVEEKYGGLKPKQLSDFKALRGDPSDNIPGVFGIGEKTAISLLEEFGSVENLYKSLSQKSPAGGINPNLKAKLKEYKEKAFISKMLAELKYDVPVDFDLGKCRWGEYDKEKIAQILSAYEFNSLIKRFFDIKNNEEKAQKGKPVSKLSPEKFKNNLKLWQ